MKRLIRESAGVLNLGATGREILTLLHQHRRRGLSVKEIIEKTKRSERAIKWHLQRLFRLKLVKREIFITPNRRRAHRYRFPSKEEFLRSVEAEIHRRLARLKRIAG